MTTRSLDLKWPFFKLYKVIDTAGWYFDVEFHDINKNRNLELFVSTWSRSGEFGQTIAYDRIGSDWRKPESWSKREIYKRFPTFANAGFGSPGGFDFAVSKFIVITENFEIDRI